VRASALIWRMCSVPLPSARKSAEIVINRVAVSELARKRTAWPTRWQCDRRSAYASHCAFQRCGLCRRSKQKFWPHKRVSTLLDELVYCDGRVELSSWGEENVDATSRAVAPKAVTCGGAIYYYFAPLADDARCMLSALAHVGARCDGGSHRVEQGFSQLTFSFTHHLSLHRMWSASYRPLRSRGSRKRCATLEKWSPRPARRTVAATAS